MPSLRFCNSTVVVLALAQLTSSWVGVNTSSSSRPEIIRLNRGYAVRSIDATTHPHPRQRDGANATHTTNQR